MKEHFKENSSSSLTQAQLDLALIMNKIENRLGALENKVDTLVNRSTEKNEEKSFSKPFQHGGHSNRFDRGRGNGSFRERSFFKVICTDCNKECEVPFKPTGDRPVYCKECFVKRKEGGSYKREPDNKPREREFIKERRFEKRHGGENKKQAGKKRKKGKQRS